MKMVYIQFPKEQTMFRCRRKSKCHGLKDKCLKKLEKKNHQNIVKEKKKKKKEMKPKR